MKILLDLWDESGVAKEILAVIIVILVFQSRAHHQPTTSVVCMPPMMVEVEPKKETP